MRHAPGHHLAGGGDDGVALVLGERGVLAQHRQHDDAGDAVRDQPVDARLGRGEVDGARGAASWW